MKTFFSIDITANGEHNNIQIQSTKLRKIGEVGKFGKYIPKAAIMCGGYEFHFEFLLTYNVEIYGTVGKVKKQKRYTLYLAKWQPYKRDKNQMLHNVLTDVARVMVSVCEKDLIEEGIIILKDQR